MVDLVNQLMKDTYAKDGTSIYYEIALNRSLQSLRRALATAKRFVLDESMSEFCAFLSSVPFKVAPQRQRDVLHSLRHSAIPPFPKMFIQFNNHAFRKGLLSINNKGIDNKDGDAWNGPIWNGNSRMDADLDIKHLDVYGKSLIPPGEDIVKDIAWLVEYDGQNVVITEFFGMNDKSDVGVLCLPYRITYSTQDQKFLDGPYRDNYADHPKLKGDWLDTKAGTFAHGLSVYSRSVGVIYNHPLVEMKEMIDVDDQDLGGIWKIHPMVVEFGGSLRYLLSFLATLNDIPKIMTEVRPHKGYLAQGRIRKYLDYTTLTLSLPQKTTKINLAKRLIAAARKGWHEVRPHWRIQNNGACARNEHIWSARDGSGHSSCHCGAKRVWIVLPHGRGDPTISIRTHKYNVTHREV